MKGLSQEMSFITKSDRNLPPPADRAFEDIEMCLQFVVSFSLLLSCAVVPTVYFLTIQVRFTLTM